MDFIVSAGVRGWRRSPLWSSLAGDLSVHAVFGPEIAWIFLDPAQEGGVQSQRSAPGILSLRGVAAQQAAGGFREERGPEILPGHISARASLLPGESLVGG